MPQFAGLIILCSLSGAVPVGTSGRQFTVCQGGLASYRLARSGCGNRHARRLARSGGWPEVGSDGKLKVNLKKKKLKNIAFYENKRKKKLIKHKLSKVSAFPNPATRQSPAVFQPRTSAHLNVHLKFQSCRNAWNCCYASCFLHFPLLSPLTATISEAQLKCLPLAAGSRLDPFGAFEALHSMMQTSEICFSIELNRSVHLHLAHSVIKGFFFQFCFSP